MNPTLERPIESFKMPLHPLPTAVELFGHVVLVEAYALTSFTGCHALVQLRDQPGKTIAVLTSSPNLESLLNTALETGNLVAFWGVRLTNPPTPMGGTWAVDVYSIDSLIVYNNI